MLDDKDIAAGARAVEEHELLALFLEEEGFELPPEQTIGPRAGGGRRALSFAQQRLWFLQQLEPESSAYNIPIAVRLRGRLDAGALGRTLDEIVRRHESLRTTFELVGGEPAQVAAAAAPVPLPVEDLRARPDREEEARRIAREEARRPFDLAAGPLLRARLLRLEDEEHVVLLTMHHIVSDAWSRGILIREAATLYDAYSNGRPSPLPELPLQYADYAEWQREWLTGETLGEQLSYWREHLAGAATLELPTDRPRPPVQSSRGAREFFGLSEELSEGVKALGRGEGVTTFMTLLAALKLVLHRHTRQEDVVVGTPIAGRGRSELEGLIGFFINTLALRTDLSGDPTFGELLGRVREVTLGAYAHQDVPFERLVEELQLERDLSRTPLFQVVFTFQNTPAESFELPGIRISAEPQESETAKFDLTLVMEETPHGLYGSFEYNTDLFDAATVRRLISHFEVVLRAVVADPARRLSAVPLLAEEERRQLLHEWQPPAARFDSAACLHELFERQAERAPDAAALTFEGETLSYGELNRRADRLARRLRREGAGPETLVGVMLERSAGLVVALLGVLKAGAAYVPLDPSYPQDRLAFMLEDAGVSVVLTQSALLEQVPAGEARPVCLDEDWTETDDESAVEPARAASPDNVAYVIYTSGSTGKPKGVAVTHANVARLFSATQHWFDFNSEDVWTLFHSYAFDFSVWELWGALLHGGRLVVVPYWVSRNPSAFRALLAEERVTVLNQTPSAFRQLMREDEQAGEESELALRYVVFGGEALEMHSLRPWFARRGDRRPRLVNMYGITETTVHVTYRPLASEDAEGASVIGQPIPDLEIYVLDSRMEPVPLGVAGELYVGGDGLARGYLNRPALTAERFVPHPFSERQGARLYKTGDLARRVNGGELEYVGRADQQVKIRGHRIELGEVEAVLAQHPNVREVVVVARSDEGAAEKYLVAYVVCREGRQATAGELRAHAHERLPEYMVPARFMTLERLPLTAHGKVDRRALPEAGGERPELEEVYEAPRTPVEEVLAAIWSEVLGVERVGAHDNFFELGGDSIRSVRILALAKEKGMDFSLQQLFRHQTVAELAGEIAAGRLGDAAARAGSEPFGLVSAEDRALLPPDLEDAYPLTMLQAGMIYHMELMPESSVYHNVDSWHLRARFDGRAFDEAVQYVVARHPVLRTSFDLAGYGEPLQLVHRSARLPIVVEDISHLSHGEQEAELAAFVERESKNRFDLARPPLLRFYIHLRDAETFQFTLTEFHPIFDGWSLTSTLSEVFTRYFALVNGERPADEPPPASTFRDYVMLERAALESDECRGFWDGKLAGCAPTRLPRWPADLREPAEEPRFREVHVRVPEEVSEGLKRAALAAKVPLKSVLLAAHLKVLSLVGGRADVMSGMVTNGRSEELDGERVRGLFLNSVPFRLRVGPGTWDDLIRQTFEAEWELLPYRRYPLSALQRRHGGQTLFESQFNFVHFHSLDDVVNSGNIQVLGSLGREEVHFTLEAAFGLDTLSKQVYLHLQFDTAELSARQREAIAGYYARALSLIAADPSARHDRAPLLSEGEREELLGAWNDTRADYPADALLHGLFERQVESTPDAAALTFEGETLSYAELDARAGALARRLRREGVGPEARVGVMMERSPELVVALLGVLKAGGAYVPLDPQYPAQRLAFMLEDAGVSVVLTQERLRESLPGHAARLVILDADSELLAGEGGEEPAAVVGAESAAYVIYTSGSTGEPKGVVMTHRGICNHLRWRQAAYPLAPGDSFLHKASISFDISVWEIFGTLMSGARLVVARPGGQQESGYLARLIGEQRVTAAHFAPVMLRAMLGEETVGGWASLRRVFCGGESLSKELQDSFFERLGAELIHQYGPTETAVDVTHWACERGGRRETLPIGRPVANTRLYVLDSHTEPSPAGVAGELYVGGASLARGYLNRPGLTAERFIPDPFSEEAGARMYRTGDVARYLADGNVEFLGRADQQVKIRGFRIEPGEVEAALLTHGGVRECAVAARGDDAAAGEKRLVAYVVGEAGAGELRRHLKESLPEYMVPSVFVALDSLPLTPNGKVNREALPAPGHERPSLEVTYAAPNTEVEAAVAEVWRQVLQVERVGVDDNFFDLGGHSLSMLRVHGKLRQAFDHDLSLVELFQYPTVRSLAAHLGAGRAAEPSLRESLDRAEARKQAAGRRRQSLAARRAGKSSEGGAG